MIGIDDWDTEKAKDQIAHGGRFGKKRVMGDVYSPVRRARQVYPVLRGVWTVADDQDLKSKGRKANALKACELQIETSC